MNAARARRFLPAGAAVALALGIGVALWTAAGAPAALLALWRPHLDLRMLREMSIPLAEPAAARRLHEESPAAHGTAADFLRAAHPGWADLVKEETVAPSGSGWMLRQARLEGGGLPMADVALLIEAAENQRPPWRVARALVEPTGPEGVVRASLALERLERAEP